MLETRIKILEARLDMERHPEDHTCQSGAILYELLNDMENLCLDEYGGEKYMKQEGHQTNEHAHNQLHSTTVGDDIGGTGTNVHSTITGQNIGGTGHGMKSRNMVVLEEGKHSSRSGECGSSSSRAMERDVDRRMKGVVEKIKEKLRIGESIMVDKAATRLSGQCHSRWCIKFHINDLSIIASQIGKLIMLDFYTSSICIESWGRSSFARCLIEINAGDVLKESLTVGVPLIEDSGFTIETINIEYE
ncbi:hypothetical protein Tco_0415346 [Tanacetum coccineum]